MTEKDKKKNLQSISNCRRGVKSGLHTVNLSWQTQAGVCEGRQNSRQTRWQTIGDKWNVFADCFCAVHTHQLEFANFSLPCEGRFNPIKERLIENAWYGLGKYRGALKVHIENNNMMFYQDTIIKSKQKHLEKEEEEIGRLTFHLKRKGSKMRISCHPFIYIQ